MNQIPSPQAQFDPTRFQSLLRACFLSDARAVENFDVWNAQINWDDHLDVNEYRLLPQLYRNLSAQGFQHSLFGKFKGIARKAWYNNNLLYHRLAPALNQVRAEGVELLALYGCALALHYDHEYVLSYEGECGFLVRPQQARTAFLSLAAHGWTPMPEISSRALDAYLNARFFHAFQNSLGERLVLQWQLFPHCNGVDTDAEYWRDMSEIEMDGVPLRPLDPTTQLVHTCLCGNIARSGSHWRRVAETLQLLHFASTQIDWEGLTLLTQKHRVTLPVCEILNAAQPFTTRIPQPSLDMLNAQPISAAEKSERVIWNAETRAERIQSVWHIAARRSCELNTTRRALTFPTFLQHWWGLENILQLAPRAIGAARMSKERAP